MSAQFQQVECANDIDLFRMRVSSMCCAILFRTKDIHSPQEIDLDPHVPIPVWRRRRTHHHESPLAVSTRSRTISVRADVWFRPVLVSVEPGISNESKTTRHQLQPRGAGNVPLTTAPKNAPAKQDEWERHVTECCLIMMLMRITWEQSRRGAFPLLSSPSKACMTCSRLLHSQILVLINYWSLLHQKHLLLT